MDARKEIELAIKKENPNWDGKTFDYGCNIYENVLECYEAIQPIIEKAGHSGMSYGMFCNIFKRLLDGKVLTPLTDDDFDEEPDWEDTDGSKHYQSNRYSAFFKSVDKKGNVSYSDNERIVSIDQYGMSWHSGATERECWDLIPQITLPYMPLDKPIKIYRWEFSYDKATGSIYKERGQFNGEYIDRIVFPDGNVVKVNRLFIDDEPRKINKSLFKRLEAFIKEDVKEFEKN